ncbi:Dedicator of cytokinesis C-terminal domain and DHR-1 domain and DHR-2 domain-containing protein [Strongyloides ratti]|uniref:Dedicator of cytokinesis C-terminal domain and DHR-1 domain and DHR-2 domain-containing protein n=1 Tax=Strongyloides ratti TaxID=34506 RepID=A0A090KWT5_STRRB|nr:Dedicator of cytokinesis C-terminal domain and DHR-1 domain and DHR-2 domain-containing protein [Strongyloides ratti]CEF61886.1 Dedicator of cytokinesis C-terminal domain and DHR-1 domain and DHR-2 domain-containing protein [Strongyloides ratti]
MKSPNCKKQMTPIKQQKSIDDRISVFSGSSENSGAIESYSNTSGFGKTGHLGNNNLRKFTNSVGRVGQAKETREACTKAMSISNPLRKTFKPKPLDYESFVENNLAQLKNEKNSGIVLFPRDDINEGKTKCRLNDKCNGIENINMANINWLITKDCLRLYNSKGKIINFNYSHKYGEYDEGEMNNVNSLTQPRFEIDQRLEEEKQEKLDAEHYRLPHIICEGMVLQLSSDNSILDKFRNGKKRYCIFKQDFTKNEIVVELIKNPNVKKTVDTVFYPKSAMIHTNKNRSVIVISDKSALSDTSNSSKDKEKTLQLAGDDGFDITKWFFDIDKAIKNCLVLDSSSILSDKQNSSHEANSSTCDDTGNDDTFNDSSISSTTSTRIHKGKNAIAKILRPPLVERNSLFKLYYQLSKLPTSTDKQGYILSRSSKLSKTFSKDNSRYSTRKGNLSLPIQSDISVTCSASLTSKNERKITIEVYDFEFKAFILPGTFEQIEPFVIKGYVFDAKYNKRLSEEFSFSVSNSEFDELLKESGYGINDKSPLSGSFNTTFSDTTLSTNTPFENLITKDRIKLFFNLPAIHESIFLIVRVERVFSNISLEPYFKPFTVQKAAIKYKKSISQGLSKLGNYRTCIAWGKRSILKGDCEEKIKLYKCDGKLTDSDLYKYLSNYNEFLKLEKNGKIITYPQANMTTRIETDVRRSMFPTLYNSSLQLVPENGFFYADSPNQSLASNINMCSPKGSPTSVFELQAFGDIISYPHSSIVNLLYVYPVHLMYNGQKIFSKARNISCSVSLISNIGDCNDDNIPRIVDTSNPSGPFLTSSECTVQYHEQFPTFNNEMKILLPITIKPTDHLLFSFKHISISNALSEKKVKENIETEIGYSWLPLSQKDCWIMKDDEQEFELPVSMNLPENYTNSFLPNKNSDAKYIENGKGLFKVKLRLISSLFSSEPRIQSFFQHCQNLENQAKDHTISHSKSTEESLISCKINSIKENGLVDVPHSISAQNTVVLGDNEIKDVKNLSIQTIYEKIGRRCDGLITVSPERITPFLYVIMNRLLSVLTKISSTNISNKVVKCIFKIFEKMHHIEKKSLFKKYVIEIVGSDTFTDFENEQIHESLVKALTPFLKSCEDDLDQMLLVFTELRVIIDIILKCMSSHIVSCELHFKERSKRFSNEFLESLKNFVYYLIDMICHRSQDLSRDAIIQANGSLMYLLRGCLSLIDRGFIFELYHYAANKYDNYESKILRDLKFDLVQSIVYHEHFLQLSLPLLVDKDYNILRMDALIDNTSLSLIKEDNKTGFVERFFKKLFSNTSNITELVSMGTFTPYMENFILNDHYCSVHFPIGLLLQELKAVMREPKESRRKVIKLLRNVLAKHSVDNRYSASTVQNRIAMLYSPLIRFVLENISEIEASAMSINNSPNTTISNNETSGIILKQSFASSFDSPLLTTITRTPKYNHYSNDMAKFGTLITKNFDCNGSSPNTPIKGYQKCNNDEKSVLSSIPEQTTSFGGKTAVATLTERLDKHEIRDLLLSVLYVIHNLKSNVFRSIINSLDDSHLSRNDANRKSISEVKIGTLHLVHLLELVLYFFHYEPQEVFINKYLSQAKKTRPNAKVTIEFPKDTLNDDDPLMREEYQKALFAYMQECNLIQEVSLIVLTATETLANHISTQSKLLSFEEMEDAFIRILNVQIKLMSEEWPESVRLHALANLGIFVTTFQKRLFINGSLTPLADLIEALLLQLNSRIIPIQNSAATLLHLVYKTNFELFSNISPAYYRQDENGIKKLSFKSMNPLSLSEKLGRSGTQTGVALAKLLGQKYLLARSVRFQKGLSTLTTIVERCSERYNESYDNAVLYLIKELKGVLNATGALLESSNDPTKLTELHIQLADSYRGSALLRYAWLQSLATSHYNKKFYSEAAVCKAHCLAIIGRELVGKNLITINWKFFDTINDRICLEEKVMETDVETVQPAGFTVENFTTKAEDLIENLFMAERYEAVADMCMMLLPIYESQYNFTKACSICTELQQSFSRLSEIKTSGKRHLGAYFRVIFYGKFHFGEEHETEWIYREPGLTSLAEASEKMLENVKNSLGHDNVKLIMDKDVKSGTFKDNIAYVQMTHVHPFVVKEGTDPLDYWANTNIKSFYYDEPKLDNSAPPGSTDVAKQMIKKVFLTIDEPFPNMKRRQKIIGKKEQILNPLEVACESLLKKADQIRKVLKTAKEASNHCGMHLDTYDKSFLDKLDLKGLQLLLQGAVQATVNSGPLAYGEAFSTVIQKQRYGEDEINRLIKAFKQLLYQCNEALKVNEVAVSSDQVEYHLMLKSSFEMLQERLNEYFGEDKMKIMGDDIVNDDSDLMEDVHNASIHILDSIAGLRE